MISVGGRGRCDASARPARGFTLCRPGGARRGAGPREPRRARSGGHAGAAAGEGAFSGALESGQARFDHRIARRERDPEPAGELDEDRARDWVVVRMVVNAGWSVQDAREADRALTTDERDWITRCIAITKAVQD